MRVSRSKLLGMGTALAAFGPSLLGPLVVSAESADPSDLMLLEMALAAERAGIKAYEAAAATKLLTPAVTAIATGFMMDHIAHRDALIGAIKAAGATPSDKVGPLDVPPLKSQHDILLFAETVERGAATAYLTSIPAFKDRMLAKVAGSILGVETTHVALLAFTLKEGAEPYKAHFVS